ncbi:unnamed protein product, partial [Polarella glacialis]
VTLAMSTLLADAFDGEVWPPLSFSKTIVENMSFDDFVSALALVAKGAVPLGEDRLAAACESFCKGSSGKRDHRIDGFYEQIRNSAIAPPPPPPPLPPPPAPTPAPAVKVKVKIKEKATTPPPPQPPTEPPSGPQSEASDLDGFRGEVSEDKVGKSLELIDGQPPIITRQMSGDDEHELNVDSLEELRLDPAQVAEAKASWAQFLAQSETQEDAGELIYAALLEKAPLIQAMFTIPRAVLGLRFVVGLQAIMQVLHNPSELKKAVEEALAFTHLNLEVTAPRVFMFRAALLDLFTQELGEQGQQEFTNEAYRGWKNLLCYIGGALVFVKSHYAERIKTILSSWKLANSKGDKRTAQNEIEIAEEEEDDGYEEDKEEEEEVPVKGRWAAMKKGMRRRMSSMKTSTFEFGSGEFFGSGESETSDTLRQAEEEKEQQKNDDKTNVLLGGQVVPSTYTEMFEFNASVMGFGKSNWLWEVNASFDDMVRNIGDSPRLQEECEVLALRISKTAGSAPVKLGEYRSVMLAALRSMLPKTWNPDHEAAWHWLWENVERLLGGLLDKPAVWEPALASLMSRIDEEQAAKMRSDVYTRFFQIAPQGQDFFKQSNTRLQFIAARVTEMTGELFADPWKMTEEISALGLRHVGYGIPTDLVGPFVSCCIEVQQAYSPEEKVAVAAFRWSLVLISKILVRVISEGSTIVMKAINANSSKMLRRAVGCAPRAQRVEWLVRIQVGTQKISPLSWAIESGSLDAAKSMFEDMLTIRADRMKYYYGVNILFETHPDIVERLCADAPSLLECFFDGLVWRSRRTVNGARRVNFYVQHLILNKDGGFAGAAKALSRSKDVKIISHPIIVFMSDTLWSGVVRRQFILSKVGFLFSLAVFMLCQAILPKTGYQTNTGTAWAIFIGRIINYTFSLTRLLGFHLTKVFRGYKTGNTMLLWGLKVPAYLKDEDAKMSSLLLVMLFLMCVQEPMFYCAPEISTMGPTEECDAAQEVISRYTIFSMAAMVLHWLLLIDLAVFSTKLAAFVLVCRHVLSEVGKFMVAMLFILILFASAISVLRHPVLEFQTVPKAANCLFALTVGLYEGDYRDMINEPELLSMVLLFTTCSAILLINLLIAQLNCSYDYVYADMLGFARLSRAALIVDTLESCPANRWKRFIGGLRFNQLLEFDEGDVGLGGGIQIREPANQNPVTVDSIRRFGGSSAPEMSWPEDETDEDDRFERVEKLMAVIAKQAATWKKGAEEQRQGSRATAGSSLSNSGIGMSGLGSDQDERIARRKKEKAALGGSGVSSGEPKSSGYSSGVPQSSMGSSGPGTNKNNKNNNTNNNHNDNNNGEPRLRRRLSPTPRDLCLCCWKLEVGSWMLLLEVGSWKLLLLEVGSGCCCCWKLEVGSCC